MLVIFIGCSIQSKENIESISILFVGNSHVRTGDVPRQLQTISKFYGVDIRYIDVSKDFMALSDTKDKAIKEMEKNNFDYVVLQDRGRRPLDNIEEFKNDIRFLCKEANKIGAKPVLYIPTFTNTNGQPDEEIQNAVTEVYKQAADENGAILANASGAWIYAYKTMPAVSLYAKFDPRGPHANNAGAYFTACVFAATLFNLHITDIIENNRYKGSDAIILGQIAWDFVKNISL
jgi:hypothetical protein